MSVDYEKLHKDRVSKAQDVIKVKQKREKLISLGWQVSQKTELSPKTKPRAKLPMIRPETINIEIRFFLRAFIFVCFPLYQINLNFAKK